MLAAISYIKATVVSLCIAVLPLCVSLRLLPVLAVLDCVSLSLLPHECLLYLFVKPSCFSPLISTCLIAPYSVLNLLIYSNSQLNCACFIHPH